MILVSNSFLTFGHTYSQWTVQVNPNFHEDADNFKDLVPFEECIELHSTEETVVRAPDYLLLTYNGRTFKLVCFTSPLFSLFAYIAISLH